jgi:multidrug transporter EmrE-like cation transporter
LRWFWILSATALEVLGDFWLKRWAGTGATRDAVLGFAIYALGSVGWVFLLKQETLQRAIVLFTAVNVVGVLLVGHFAFDERLRTKEAIAAGLALFAIALAEWP